MHKAQAQALSTRASLRLLGGFVLERPGQAIDNLSYEKGKALLAYVALESGFPHARRTLASLLWPDHSLKTALANLRLVLLNLRQSLNSENLSCLQVDRDSVKLDLSLLGDLDVTRFALTKPACACPETSYRSPECAGCLKSMAAGIEAYRGQFMAGFSLPECPDFEEWLQQQRETMQRHALELANRLADCHERRGEYAASQPFALRYLELAPWDEDGYRRAIRLLALNGHSGAALAQFERCARMLKDELGIEPSEATRQLAKRIREGDLQREAGLAATSLSSPPSQPAFVLPPPTERRQVTVLYGELSAGGIEDPDEASRLLYPAQCGWAQAIMRCSGHAVQTYTGGLLAYFGYPAAHENAVREALLAALAITRAPYPGVEIRLGVHTGQVVSGGTAAVPDMVGTTTSLAIRLRLLVENGGIAVSGDTVRLAEGYFSFAPLGEHSFPGVARPLPVFRMLGESRATHRLAAAERLTPLAGRETELNALMHVWAAARAGHRQNVLLRGEAGIGKSRLLLAVRERLVGQKCVIREVRCVPEFSQSPFQPLIAATESLLGFTATDDNAVKFRRLATYLESAHQHMAADAVPLLAAFLSLPALPPYAEPMLPPTELREATLDLLQRLLIDLAMQQPVLLLIEDLHWAAPSTFDLIRQFVSRSQDVPMLVLMTARPEYSPTWSKDRVQSWILGGLEDDEVASIITAQAPTLYPELLQRLVERADGIPLFAEELAKIASADEDNEIPAPLRDLLAARLDASGPAKATAQLAATIGRDFDLDLLRRISPLAPEALSQALHDLELAALVKHGDGTAYQFRHALIRDVAYQSQTRAIRQTTHLRIAEALLANGGNFVDKHPEVIARHLAAGEDFARSVVYWLSAGNSASQYAANHEAVQFFRAGLQLIDHLPAGLDRTHLEFALQNGLVLASIALGGYASAEASDALARVATLCEQHPGSPDMFRAVWGLWASASSRSGYHHAFDLAQQLLRMAEQSGDAIHLQQAHFALGNTLFWQGKFLFAREHLDTALASYRPAHRARHLADFGEDLRVTAGSYLSWTLEFLGSPESAERVSTETLATARRLKHPFSLGYALTFGALLQCRLQQPKRARALAAEAIRLADGHGFHLWGIGGRVARGWVNAAQGQLSGVSEISQCVDAINAAMSGVTLRVLTMLADAQVRTRRFEEADETIRRALSTGKALDDHHLEAELLCLRGQALHGQSPGNAAAATECFEQALALSRQQHTPAIERQVRLAQEALKSQPSAGSCPASGAES